MPPERALEPSVPSIVRPGFVRRERLLPFAPLLPFKALATPARRRPLGPTTAARTSTQASWALRSVMAAWALRSAMAVMDAEAADWAGPALPARSAGSIL